MDILHTLSEAWPIMTGMFIGIAGAAVWASKMFSLQMAVLAKLETMNQNLATHEHDDAGRVIIPAR